MRVGGREGRRPLVVALVVIVVVIEVVLWCCIVLCKVEGSWFEVVSRCWADDGTHTMSL